MKMQHLEGKEAVRETTETMHVRETWSWLWKAYLNIQTQALTQAGQPRKKLSEPTTCIPCNIDKTAESPQKQRHDNYIAKVVHWKLCEKCHLEKKKERKKKKEKWYEQVSDSSSETMKLNYCTWDTNIQCDQVIEARRPDLVVVKNWTGEKVYHYQYCSNRG